MTRDMDGRTIKIEKDSVGRDGTLTGVCVTADGSTLMRLDRAATQEIAVHLVATLMNHSIADPFDMFVDLEGAATLEGMDRYQAGLPEWDREPSCFQPTLAWQAKAMELLLVRLAGTDWDWHTALLGFATDVNREQIAPAAVWAVVDYACFGHMIAAQSRQGAIDHVRRDLEVSREQLRQQLLEGNES